MADLYNDRSFRAIVWPMACSFAGKDETDRQSCFHDMLAQAVLTEEKRPGESRTYYVNSAKFAAHRWRNFHKNFRGLKEGRRKVFFNSTEMNTEAVMSVAPANSNNFIDLETWDLLAAFGEFATNKQFLVLLYRLMGCSSDEIAERLNISGAFRRQTVENLRSSAYDQLRTFLQSEGLMRVE